MDLEKFGLPKEASEGQWFDYVNPITGHVIQDVRFKIASSDTDEYRLHLAGSLRRHSNEALRSSRNRQVLPTAEQEESASISAMARFVLRDFEGIEIEGVSLSGNKIEDRERVLKQVLVREFVNEKAQHIARVMMEDEELKNSQSGQSGHTAETTQNETS